MKRENLLARLLRALSGKSQERIAEEIGVHFTLIGHLETGLPVKPEHLQKLARAAGITLPQAWELLGRYEAFARRRRTGRGADVLFDELAEDVRANTAAAHQRLLLIPLPAPLPQASDRQCAEELWGRLAELSEEARLAIVRVDEEYQTWALCERFCVESEREASRDVERAAGLVRIAQEIAERVPGPEAWRNSLRGLALGHSANVLRVFGELKAADAGLEDAQRLSRSGSDPGAVLDLGRLLDLEASLRRAQRRFDEALAALDQAFLIGRSPARILVKKAFTLEVMGDYEQAIETLLQAAPLVEIQGDPRLLYMQRFNLAVNFCHTGRYNEATQLLAAVRELTAVRGDENESLRVTWLEGRIASGLGHHEEALQLLQQARRGFKARSMSYDVALALLEEALLGLEQGRTADVKDLALDLAEVFKSKGVHREALAALRLFHKAAERETATPDMVRRLLAFLHRARYDQGLRFTL